jgi:hypothetical protein
VKKYSQGKLYGFFVTRESICSFLMLQDVLESSARRLVDISENLIISIEYADYFLQWEQRLSYINATVMICTVQRRSEMLISKLLQSHKDPLWRACVKQNQNQIPFLGFLWTDQRASYILTTVMACTFANGPTGPNPSTGQLL